MKETLREFVDSRGLKIGIDRPGGMIRGVKILGSESRNGRTYLPQAIRDAALLYEEAKVNVNHHQQQLSAPRDYRDRIGVIRNVSFREGDGLFADFHFNPKHELAEQFLWDAEHAPENVGFSHNVTAQTSRDGEKIVVEKILKVQSVDLVADPATTSGLFEAVEKPEELIDSADCGPSESNAADAQEEAINEAAEARDRLQEECDQLHQELAQLRYELRTQKRLRTIEQLFAEAGLPQPGSGNPWEELTSGNAFVESLLKLDDDCEMREQIYRRAELIKQTVRLGGVGTLQPHARERPPFASPKQPNTTESFISAITF